MASNEQSDRDVLKLEHIKPRLPKKPQVIEIRAEPYTDSVGEHELRVWVILREDTADEDREWSKLAPIRVAIFEALKGVERSRYPYIHFRKPSEMQTE